MTDFEKIKNARKLIEQSLELDYFHPNGDGVTPIPAYYRQGIGNFAVVVGENASGKSFYRRIVQAMCKQQKLECMYISMEARRGISSNPLMSLVYGDEERDSTGFNSARTVSTGIETCQKRETDHVIFWDEPDLGLADGAAAGVGIALRDFAQKMPKHTLAAFVVTHSRALVRELLDRDPHYLHLGAERAPRTLEAWLQEPVLPRSPEEVCRAGRERFKLIQAILSSKGADR